MPEAVAERTYEPVIGLEIHVQLSTRTKMFCGCELSFGEEPNTRTCPVCLGLPGTLPAVNAEAIHYGLMIGMALECEPAPRSIFHRKNYFYPDLPKGYQVSQYDIPLARDGRLGDIRIHRVHLEEDAAKLVHAGASGRIHSAEASTVDFNRGGTPLVEIVTEPDVRSAAQAAEWLRLLRVTLRQLGVSDVNMEEGSLRCDANVSIRPAGEARLGVKTELKNMNSFRYLERGVEAEIARQEELLRDGETRLAGDAALRPAHRRAQLRCAPRRRRMTTATSPSRTWCPLRPPMRCSSAPAVRFPSCPPSAPSASSATTPCRRSAAHLLAFRTELGDFFEATVAAADGADPRAIANWVTGELVARLGEEDPADSKVEPEALARLVAMVGDGRVAGSAAKDVLAEMVEHGGDPEADRRAEGARQGRRGRAGRDRGAGDGRAARGRRQGPRGKRQGDRGDHGSRHARDQGPCRRRRGAAPDPRTPLGHPR